jgi:hypothetical protein
VLLSDSEDATPQVSETIRQLLEIVETFDTGVEQPDQDSANPEMERVLSAGGGRGAFGSSGSNASASGNYPTRVSELSLSRSCPRCCLQALSHCWQCATSRQRR